MYEISWSSPWSLTRREITRSSCSPSCLFFAGVASGCPQNSEKSAPYFTYYMLLTSKSKFWKVSALVYLLYKTTIRRTHQRFCLLVFGPLFYLLYKAILLTIQSQYKECLSEIFPGRLLDPLLYYCTLLLYFTTVLYYCTVQRFCLPVFWTLYFTDVIYYCNLLLYFSEILPARLLDPLLKPRCVRARRTSSLCGSVPGSGCSVWECVCISEIEREREREREREVEEVE